MIIINLEQSPSVLLNFFIKFFIFDNFLNKQIFYSLIALPKWKVENLSF